MCGVVALGDLTENSRQSHHVIGRAEELSSKVCRPGAKHAHLAYPEVIDYMQYNTVHTYVV